MREILLVLLVAGCVGSASIAGTHELDNVVRGEGAALATHFAHLITPKVDGTELNVLVKIGSIDLNQTPIPGCDDCHKLEIVPLREFSLSDVRYSLNLPDGWEVVSGSSAWTGSIQEGQMIEQIVTVRPTRPGVWQFESEVLVQRDQIGVPGNGPDYPDRRQFYVFFDGEQILLSKTGDWCPDGMTLDEQTLTCTAARAVPV